MTEPTHAPGWRGRPNRIGPILAMGERERPSALDRLFCWICYSLAASTLAVAAYAWGADFFAGHL